MTDRKQRYEYKTCDLSISKPSDPAEVLNEYAENGWRLVHTIEANSDTVQFVLERQRE